MEQVPPRSESTMKEQQEKYPNDWPVITPEQERIRLGLPAVPPMPEARRVEGLLFLKTNSRILTSSARARRPCHE